MGKFNERLQKIDFSLHGSDGGSTLLISHKHNTDLSPDEVFALEIAGSKFNATAVYFRHFAKDQGRSPIPQVYLYDNTNNQFSENDLAIIHRDLWSNSQIPLFIVLEETDVKIFDTRKPVIVDENSIRTKAMDQLSYSADALKQYSEKLFDSGFFWDSEKAAKHFRQSTSAYKDLIDGLKRIHDSFLATQVLPENLANKLLVFAILIKYLEERGNEDGELLAKDFFLEFGANNFCGVLRQKGKIVELFKKLSNHFNGRIFEWASEEEERAIRDADLSDLADFLDADIDEHKQLVFWRRYSFNKLPVELISTVYETFLINKKDAVYTPEFLVNTILDEVLPLRDYETLRCKTIDVSCGSGIFLVGAFKRLVQRYRFNHFKKTGVFPNPTPDTLVSIVKENLFGVDIEEESIRLTIFSLCLALCDELTPKQIWTELKFDEKLNSNFVPGNFFSFLKNANNADWDLVVGNPPFKELSPDKPDYKEIIELNQEVKERLNLKIYPQNQLALMFLDQSTRLLKKEGLICLILPAAPLLYNNSHEFRRHFFTQNTVTQILDFTILDVFKKYNPKTKKTVANIATVAIFAEKKACNKKNIIKHKVFRRTKSARERLFLEIDKYDIHLVPHEESIIDKHVWKSNLLGGGRLNSLINRLASLRTIGDLIDTSKGWIVNEGYIIGSKSQKPAPYITGKRLLPTEAFTEEGVDRTQITTEHALLFEGPRTEELFTPPHLLIKENMGRKKIPTYLSDEYLTFKDSIVGISVPGDDRDKLSSLESAFEKNADIYRVFIAATSNKYLVKKATVLQKQDLMALPYPEQNNQIKLSFTEQILCEDVLDHYIKVASKSHSDTKVANESELVRFGEIFSRALNSVYGDSSKSFMLKKIYECAQHYLCGFEYGEFIKYEGVELDPTIAENLDQLVMSKYGESVHVTKVVKLYEKNKILLLKPKMRRFWLRSIALRDADEVFSDLIKAGY